MDLCAVKVAFIRISGSRAQNRITITTSCMHRDNIHRVRLRSGSAVSALLRHTILVLRLINDKDRVTQSERTLRETQARV